MRLILAPMEGVIDHNMRALLTRCGVFERCVTEFVRVTDQVLPPRVFLRLCPELEHGGVTPTGTPVYVQLLGSNLETMAACAARACHLGAVGIDLNFGCPARVVNRHDGGSALLKEPSRVAAIVAAVRDRVDPSIPVTAKIRLGFSDASRLQEIVDGIAAAGASELGIHARTREDGYRPPAHWHHIGRLEKPTGLVIVANGEIWSVGDGFEARHQSGCDDLMLGRGALAQPDLSLALRAAMAGNDYVPLDWPQVAAMVETMFHEFDSRSPRHTGNRTKQWLAYLRRRYPEAGNLFQLIRRLRDRDEIGRTLAQYRRDLGAGPGSAPPMDLPGKGIDPGVGALAPGGL